MVYRGAPLTSTNFVLDTFTATAGQTVFALSRAPASAQSVILNINGSTQIPGVGYTISGSTLTLTAGAALNDSVWAVHLGVQGVLTTPADGSVTYAKLAADAQMPVLMTPAVTTSGTTFDFTSIPVGVKMISVQFKGNSLSGTDDLLVQIGDSGGVETTGYLAESALLGASTGISTSTAGFIVRMQEAVSVLHGSMFIVLHDAATNSWAASHSARKSASFVAVGGGGKSLSATLDRVRITRTGSDTFDAGEVSVAYWR